jgi:uncharacterized protein (DUF1778 family)
MTMQNSTARLEARIAPETHALLKRAADLEGRSLTDFVVSAALIAARRTIDQSDILRLSAESSAFVAGLLADAAPAAPALTRAKAHHDRLTRP